MILVGPAMLSEIHRLTRAEGVILRLAAVIPPVLKVLQTDGTWS